MTEHPYGGAPPFQSHSDTSRAAAMSVADDAVNLRVLVYEHLLELGPEGATDDELHVAFKNIVRPRRCELTLLGLAVDSKLRRKTRKNRNAVVWVAVAPEQAKHHPTDPVPKAEEGSKVPRPTPSQFKKCVEEMREASRNGYVRSHESIAVAKWLIELSEVT